MKFLKEKRNFLSETKDSYKFDDCSFLFSCSITMRFSWLFVLPTFGLRPAVIRYLRIQGNTNAFLKELYSHTTGKVVSSFVPLDGPVKEILQNTVYECVENRTLIAEYVAKHLLIQMISYEVNEGVHEMVKKLTHVGH
jgi:hypothetical protein